MISIDPEASVGLVPDCRFRHLDLNWIELRKLQMNSKTHCIETPRIELGPTGGITIGDRHAVTPTLQIRGGARADLDRLTIWVNGRDVIGTVANDIDITDRPDGGLELRLPKLRLGRGLHQIRASFPSADGRIVALAEEFYEVGGPGPAGSVIDPRGSMLSGPEAPASGGGIGESMAHKGNGCHCCCGTGGVVPIPIPIPIPFPVPTPGGGQAEPPRNPGAPDPMDNSPIARDCRIVRYEADPGPIVAESVEKVTLRAVTDPADEPVEFALNLLVDVLLVGQLSGSLATVTRERLGRLGTTVTQRTSIPGSFYRVGNDGKSVDVLVKQIVTAFRNRDAVATTFMQSGLPVQVIVGVRCKRGGRRFGLPIRITD